MFVLSKAHYYKETPQYKVIGIFASKKLAQQYLRNLKSFDSRSNTFSPSIKYKNASFSKFNEYRLYDDGVVTSWKLEEIPVYNSTDEFPLATATIQKGGIKFKYQLEKDGSITETYTHV